jgi:hypothetical protein
MERKQNTGIGKKLLVEVAHENAIKDIRSLVQWY